MQWVYYRPMKFTGNASDRALSMEMARQPSSWLEDVQSVKGKHAKWWSWSAKENVGCWEAAPKRKGDDRKDDSKCFPSCLFTEVTMKLNAIAISKWEAQEKAKAEKAKKAAAVAAQAKAAAATGRKRKQAISAAPRGELFRGANNLPCRSDRVSRVRCTCRDSRVWPWTTLYRPTLLPTRMHATSAMIPTRPMSPQCLRRYH